MKRKYIANAVIILLILAAFLYLVSTIKGIEKEEKAKRCKTTAIEEIFKTPVIYAAPSNMPAVSPEVGIVTVQAIETETQEPAYILSDEEFELLARLVTAEAENQSFEAQYYVACVVMNRVESDYFPDSVTEVIWQKEPARQFSSMWNGRYDSCVTTDSCYEAVTYLIENGNELPANVLYFTSCGYLPGTVEYKQVMDMYYSSQKE